LSQKSPEHLLAPDLVRLREHQSSAFVARLVGHEAPIFAEPADETFWRRAQVEDLDSGRGRRPNELADGAARDQLSFAQDERMGADSFALGENMGRDDNGSC